MPLRCLEYYVNLLYGIIPAKARYNEKRISIPTPEFYVFYNGKHKTENEYTMKLSDAFFESQNEPMCELKVKFMSIVGDDGKNLSVVQNCDILKQYCEFMDIVSRYKSELKDGPTTEEQKGCYEKALHEAISRGILTDYLTRKGVAVINMLTDEYDYELDMQTKAEEARQEKAEEVVIELLKEDISPETIAKCVKLPLEQVLELQKKIMVKA